LYEKEKQNKNKGGIYEKEKQKNIESIVTQEIEVDIGTAVEDETCKLNLYYRLDLE